MGESGRGQKIWVQWVTLAVIILVYTSLWLIQAVEWHLGVSLVTLVLLATMAKAPLKTLGFILGLIAFLVVLQLTFSSYMRTLFLSSLQSGFQWNDWVYLLYAVERLALPLMLISVFTPRVGDPRTIAALSSLLNPLKYLGLNVKRLQSVLLLALRFLPTLRTEWKRFSYFQTYFAAGPPRKRLIDRIRYLRGVLKAMITHVVDRAVATGDLLAIRGLPNVQFSINVKDLIFAGIPWLGIGILTLMTSQTLSILWSCMTLWMILAALSLETGEVS